MAGSSSGSLLSRPQIGMFMLRLKAKGLKKKLAGAPKTPEAATAGLQKLAKESVSLTHWMKVAQVDVRHLERIVYHGK